VHGGQAIDHERTAVDGPLANDDGTDPELSVVVVTYNEADRIADALDAIFAACQGVTSFEVLLVDSNSTDDTVDIASEYDVTIYRIPDDGLTTPGAGRYVGTQHASGDTLLFVDGDVVVSASWVEAALDALDADPDLAGIDGHLNERRADEATSVDYCHGVVLYDRAALSEVDGFHPFLLAWEDVDLGFQLRLADHELQRLPMVAGTHPIPDSPLDQFRRWRRGYYRAGGQVCSKALTRPRLLARWLWYFRDKAVSTTWLALGLVALVVQPLVLAGWALASVAGTAFLCHRLGVHGATKRAISSVLFPLGFVLGFEKLPAREEFPLDAVETVQTGSVWHADRSRPTATD